MKKEKPELAIFALDRGRVSAAWHIPHPEKAFHYQFLVARVIRRWGTERGLAQLARQGPISGSTVLDDPYSGEVPWRAVLEIIYVPQESVEKWKKHLPEPRAETQ